MADTQELLEKIKELEMAVAGGDDVICGLKKELDIADERWKRAEAHHQEFHEDDYGVCESVRMTLKTYDILERKALAGVKLADAIRYMSTRCVICGTIDPVQRDNALKVYDEETKKSWRHPAAIFCIMPSTPRHDSQQVLVGKNTIVDYGFGNQ